MTRLLFLWVSALNAVVGQTANGGGDPNANQGQGMAFASPTPSLIMDPTAQPSLSSVQPSFLNTQPSFPNTQPSFPNTPASETGKVAGSSPQSTQAQPHKSSNTAAIAGGVIGGVGGLLLIALIAYYLRRRRLSKRVNDGSGYGKTPSDLVYRTTDMSSDSSPITQTQYGLQPKAPERSYPGHSHPPASYGSQEPNYAEGHSASREAAKVILSPTAVRPQGQPAPAIPTTNELDSTEVNEDGVSVRSPSPDIDTDGRFDSITPTPESQAARGHVPRLPLISRTKDHNATI